MLRKMGMAVYRGFFWTYERGTWQYDVMVVLILAFIFITPRQWFHDRPPSQFPTSSGVTLLLNGTSQKIYQLRAALIDGQSDTTLEQSVQRVLHSFTGKSLEITRIEPAKDSSGQVVSYAVWVRE
jgi:hypothetical protein